MDALAALAVQRWLGSCRRRQVVLAPAEEGTRHFMRPSCPRLLRQFPFLFFFTLRTVDGHSFKNQEALLRSSRRSFFFAPFRIVSFILLAEIRPVFFLTFLAL